MMVDNRKETIMDISNATALASTIVALIAPALIQTLKKHIPEGFTAFTTLGVIAIAATNGFTGYGWHHTCRGRWRGTSRVHAGEPGTGNSSIKSMIWVVG